MENGWKMLNFILVLNGRVFHAEDCLEGGFYNVDHSKIMFLVGALFF